MEDDSWTDNRCFGRVVNWSELDSLIKGPFAKSLRYKLVRYSERFPIEDNDEQMMKWHDRQI